MNVPDWIMAAPSPLDVKLGLELIEVTPTRASGRYPIAGNTQPAGLWHGGATCVAAETMASLAAAAHAGPTGQVVGVELNASHLRSPKGDWVTATATSLHLGRQLATYEVRLVDDSGSLIAVARVTAAIRRGHAASE